MAHRWKDGRCVKCGRPFVYVPRPAGRCPGTHVVTFRTAMRDHLKGVRTFYLSSLTTTDEYVLKVIRRRSHHGRRVTCSCPDYFHRGGPLGRGCKHCRILRDLIAHAGGVSRIPNGLTITVPLTERRQP